MKKDEVEKDSDHDKKIRSGLSDIKKIESQADKDKDGDLTQEEAEKVASTIKKKHKVFKKFYVVNGGKSWDYRYTASPEKTVKGSKKEEGEKGLKRIKRKTLFFKEITIPDTNIILNSQTAEYRRQIKNQESAINKMIVEMWFKRRNTFLAKKTKRDNNQVVKRRIKSDLMREFKARYMQKLLSRHSSESNPEEKVDQIISKYVNRLVDANFVRILHNPDRVAGGNPKIDYVEGDFSLDANSKTSISLAFKQIPIVGNERANGMLGLEWKNGNAKALDNHVRPIYNKADKEEKKQLQMSVTLKVK